MPRTTGSLISPHKLHLKASACDSRSHAPPPCLPGPTHHIRALAIDPPLRTLLSSRPMNQPSSKWKLQSIHVRASHLRRSFFQQLSQPLSAASDPPQRTASAAPGASPGVLGMKGDAAGHCSQGKHNPLAASGISYLVVCKTAMYLSQQLSMIDAHSGSVSLGISSL